MLPLVPLVPLLPLVLPVLPLLPDPLLVAPAPPMSGLLLLLLGVELQAASASASKHASSTLCGFRFMMSSLCWISYQWVCA
jgi:hypothetical protein